MLTLSERPIDLADYLSLSVGGLEMDFRGRTGVLDGKEIDLTMLANNVEILRSIANGSDIRWLMLTSETATIPYEREWKVGSIFAEVENIAMARRAAQYITIDTTGFEGRIDYVLINHLETRRMLVLVMFDSEADAVLAKMRHSLE